MIKRNYTLREAHKLLRDHADHPPVKEALHGPPKAPRRPQELRKGIVEGEGSRERESRS